MAKRTNYSITDINDKLRARFGNTITRAQILEFRDSDGVWAQWLQRDPALKIGRGLYRIPAKDGSVSAVVNSPVPATRQVKRQNARKSANTINVPAMIAGSNAPEVVAMNTSPVVPTATITVQNTAMEAATDRRVEQKTAILSKLESLRQESSLLSQVPKKDVTFVPFGDYTMCEQIIGSNIFYPVFITGLSGNGKTYGIQQACANLKREYIRVPITIETEEDDLLGGFRLHNGETEFEPGPVIIAMLRGAVLLLDEIDKASAKIMCLQPVLEGQPVVLKKYGVTITPAPGFTVFATANTKGRGSENGRFNTSMQLDEAFLERFPITVEQEYPSVAVEKKILMKNYEKLGKTVDKTSEVFFETLSKWAEAIRVAFREEAIEDVISTRRLIHIVGAYAIFGAQDKALAYCLNRFDDKVQEAFSEFYNKLVPNNTPSTVGHVAAPGTPTF
jgi:AAA domain (dynein-related subfamily)